ncbi:hypothetical protein RHMOL_Rhmol01G0351600 [Rhododendron molle]|uniref:Uncharacterized protein n=1 Tax=Rhododendron molle TaxID=49168 RepID=A0ACC0QAD1_RHOML|nr:hypothetical protein RHMOL_Rhmol01G0351600 [Rhododendron molle]
MSFFLLKFQRELLTRCEEAEEHVVGRDVGGLAANGQGKPKRGRGGPRDAKRIRQSSDADYDYEDDPDLL